MPKVDPRSPGEGRRAQEKELRAKLTNEVIRAIRALASQQNVCREQDGQVVFVTGIEAAREYLIEQVRDVFEGEPASEDGLAVVVDAVLRASGFDPLVITNSELYADFMTVAKRAYNLGHLHGSQELLVRAEAEPS